MLHYLKLTILSGPWYVAVFINYQLNRMQYISIQDFLPFFKKSYKNSTEMVEMNAK